ncbi:MAG: helix-turn-helix transcriptional regulator [Thermodesulfobacteriota bacterium]
MKITHTLADDAILTEIGKRVARRRLNLQLTQADLAEESGVSKRTVERIEAGASAQMSSMVRIFRVLELLPGLESIIPEAGPGPMDLLRQKGKVRQRASSKRKSDRNLPGRSDEPWSWDDEK